jgi:hypothetical protein
MRRSCAISLLLVLVLVPAADAKHKRQRCAAGAGIVVLHSKKAVVLKQGNDYYGCLRSTRRRFYVASSSHNQYESTEIGPTLLRGVYFSYATESGDINEDCRASVSVVSIRTRAARYAVAALGSGKFGACPSVSKLVGTGSGAVAWTASQGSDKFVRTMARGTLDQGPDIDVASLALAGTTISWTNGGAVRSAQLP